MKYFADFLTQQLLRASLKEIII